MAHFAKLSDENMVLQVVTIEDSKILDSNQNESEAVGQAYLEKHNNWPANMWKKTSYGTEANKHYQDSPEGRTLSADQTKAFRKNYAGIGFTYDQSKDAFISPKPFNSWILNETTCLWEPPVANPDPTKPYDWNEETTSWDLRVAP